MHRVGIIGLGRGWAHADVARQFDGVQVVAACDVDPGRCAQAREHFGLEAAYEDLDAFLAHGLDIVIVASPPVFHTEHAIAALESGCHVLCEVPIVQAVRPNDALRQASALITAVRHAERASGARFMFAENTNYWWFVREWQQHISSGKLGQLVYIEAEYVHNCRGSMQNSDGSLTWRAHLPPIHYCTHSLGPVLSFLGERCVRAVGMSTGTDTAPQFPAPDMQVALLTTESGAVIKLLCGFKVEREPSHHYFSLYGTRGSIETVRNEARARGHFADSEIKGMAEMPFSLSRPGAPNGATRGGHGTAEHDMFADFLRAIYGGAPVPIDVFDGLEMTLPGIYAHESAANGNVPIDIPDVRTWYGARSE